MRVPSTFGGGSSGGSGASGSWADTLYLDVYYQPFNFTYHLVVDPNTCTITNGADVTADELNRFTNQVTDSMTPAWSSARAAGYLAPLFGQVEGLRGELSRKVASATGCSQKAIKYDVGGYCMDMSGIGNVAFGYFLVTVPNIIDDSIANFDQSINPNSFGQTSDNPDDVAQRRGGEYIANQVISGRYLGASLVEEAAEYANFFCQND